MSVKPGFIQLWSSQALPATGVVTSPIIPIMNQVGFAAQVVWGSGLTGTFQIQTSSDRGYLNPDGTASGVTNWTSVTGLSAAVSGSAGSAQFNFPNSMMFWAQLIYTATSGTGTASATANTKG